VEEAKAAEDADGYVSVEGAEVDEGVQPGNAPPDKKPFGNFQKKGNVPNISNVKKRPAGIAKGMWRKENLRQAHGVDKFKKQRRGARAKPEGPASRSASNSKSAPKTSMLGKREAPGKTATTHKTNTSTFKNQAKKKQK